MIELANDIQCEYEKNPYLQKKYKEEFEENVKVLENEIRILEEIEGEYIEIIIIPMKCSLDDTYFSYIF
jgi:hypothetical protein